MKQEAPKLVIKSVRRDGKPFRPSDWIERIAANMGTFGPDHRLHYSSSVHPCIHEGEKCLRVDESLKERDPVAYDYILGFAENNQLMILTQ